MTLSTLIRKGGLAKVATATPATLATQGAVNAGTVAEVASVAVAKPRDDETDPLIPAAEARRQRVMAMLADNPGIRYAVESSPQINPATHGVGYSNFGYSNLESGLNIFYIAIESAKAHFSRSVRNA